MTLHTLCTLPASIHDLFRQCSLANAPKNRRKPGLTCSPKAEATSSNLVGCTTFPPFLESGKSDWVRYRVSYPHLFAIHSRDILTGLMTHPTKRGVKPHPAFFRHSRGADGQNHAHKFQIVRPDKQNRFGLGRWA